MEPGRDEGGNARGAAERSGAGRAGAAVDEALERLWRLGAAALGDAELIEVLLGGCERPADIGALSRELVTVGGGLKALAQSDPQELCQLPGLGRERAAQLLCALEVGRRAQRAQETRPRLRTPEEVHRHLLPLLGGLRREVFHVLCFNPRNVLVRQAQVAEGTTTLCPVDPREVFVPAVLSRASGIVVAHNHPSGDPEPSDEDIELTFRLAEAGRLLGVRVLDHLVLGDGLYVSFAERGLLEPPRRARAAGSGRLAGLPAVGSRPTRRAALTIGGET